MARRNLSALRGVETFSLGNRMNCFRPPPAEPASSPEALERLWHEHQSWVTAVARRQVGDAGLAEEITQDVFLQLAQLPALPDSPEAARSWLLRCAWFVAANARRKRQRREKMLEAWAGQADEEASPIPSPGLSPEEWDVALGSLPETERALLLGHFFEGRSYAEVAQEHSLTAEAARKRIDRALQRLRRTLARRGFTLSMTALAAGLGAPGSAAGSLVAGGALTTFFTTMTAAKSTALTAVLCLAAALGPWLHQRHRIAELEGRLADARQAADVVRRPKPLSPAPFAPALAGERLSTAPHSVQTLLRALPEILAAPPGAPNQALLDAMAAVLKEPDATRRQTHFSLLCELVQEEDIAPAIERFSVEEKRGVLRVAEAVSFRYRQGQLQGKEALVAKVGDPPLAPLDRLSAALLEGWASRDPQEVYRWLEQLPEGFDFRAQALKPLFESALRDHPDFAASMAEQAPANTARTMLQQMALREIDVGGVQGLEAWFRALPERDNWQEARRDLAFLLAERQSFANPAAALRTLEDGYHHAWGGEELAKKIAARFGQVNEGKVIAMLEMLPVESPLAGTLADTLFSSMAKHQQNVAAEFLNKHPDFVHYDRAAESFAKGIFQENPEMARAWAATLKDSARRAEILQKLQ